MVYLPSESVYALMETVVEKEMLPRIVGVDRHRLLTDGEGVTTLVAFHGCPLRCRYCLNPHALTAPGRWRRYRCCDLYDMVKVDELYFLATGGGVTFGGGEPALHPGFIEHFRACCGKEWLLTLETSLQAPLESVARLEAVVDRFIVDIKDMNPEIYRRYTGGDNAIVAENLHFLLERGRGLRSDGRRPRDRSAGVWRGGRIRGHVAAGLGMCDLRLG